MSALDPDPRQKAQRAWRARLRRWRPWALPAAACVLALIASVILLGRLRDDVWAYYTDGKDLQADAGDERARPVLWEDPRQNHFDEPAGEAAPEPGKSANAPADKLEATFSADGTTMILVRWQSPGTDADMYLSRWDGRTWSRPQPIDSINTGANERGPALSRDGHYLYFASDRVGGFGGYDLYVARWNGRKWAGVEPLPSEVNSTADELGPALSADETQLFFSTNRDGADDIYLSKVTIPEVVEKPKRESRPAKRDRKPERRKKGKRKAIEVARAGDSGARAPVPVPEFGPAEPAHALNSKASDVEAAVTGRGDHVFLASDRDRSKKHGYKVYWSRVVDGATMPPEEVDLYIREGDVTDPAVRMDGFDLLFSSRGGPAPGDAGETGDGNYLLYRSTTREVFGYTDISRWEQFKDLMRNIAWWILLAIAALIALIYLLERWEDMTSLFHKCLAASVALHLLWLFMTMVWLIAKQVEEDDKKKQEEVVISIDALAEEELAMESVPQETAIADATTNLETEKAEAEFGAPGFEAPEEAQPVPDAAQTTKEALLVEAEPAMSEPVEPPVSEPVEPTELLEALAETSLPEVDQPLLEERDPADPQPVADTSEEVFEPDQPTTEFEKADAPKLAEAAMEAPMEPTEVTEATPPEPLADSPKESVVEAEIAETQPPEEPPAETEPLESQMLAALPESAFVDPNESPLEETNPATPTEATPADPAQEVFQPSEAVPNVTSTPAENSELADAAVPTAADPSAMPPAETAAGAPAADAVPTVPGEAASASDLPPSEFPPLAAADLPSPAMPGAPTPTLEEASSGPSGDPADTSQDMFQPSEAVASLNTDPSGSRTIPDAAVPDAAAPSEVTPAERVAGSPAVEARPSEVSESTPSDAIPSSDIADALPAPTLVDPGAPTLEEANPNPDAAPANPSEDMFQPSQAVASLNTDPAGSRTITDAAVPAAAAPSEVTPAERVAGSPAIDALPSEVSESTPADAIPSSDIADALPAPTLVDPGAPTLEEANPNPDAAPANPSEDMFQPSQAVASLNTDPAGSRTIADAAVPVAATPSEVTPAERVAGFPAVEARPSEVSKSAPAGPMPPSDIANTLPAPTMVDPGAPTLEEANPNPDAAPANPSEDMFQPSQAVASLNTDPAGSRTIADAAVPVAATPSEVTPAERVAGFPAVEARPSEVIKSAPAGPMPPSDIANTLPALTMVDPGAPKLEEADPNSDAAPANPSEDMFKPGAAVASFNTDPAGSRTIADAAVPAAAASSEVTPAERVAGSPAVEARPSETSTAAPVSPLPPSDIAGNLPAPTLVDPGAPKLEEPGQSPAAGKADAARDKFKPTGDVPNLVSAPARSKAMPDIAAADQSDADAVAGGTRAARRAPDATGAPAPREAAVAQSAPAVPATPGALPALTPIDPGAPKLEEPGERGGKPADTSKDKFVPGGVVPNLATSQAGGSAVADSAAAARVAADAVAEGKRDTGAAAAALSGALEAAILVASVDAGPAGPILDSPSLLPMPGLPGSLEGPKNIDPGELAREIRKQRGKPGIDTIKEMGGSEGTEGAIGSAIEWLVKNQEKDGRWDTRKHGAKHNYDTGGTGLALLCFYGWGERHDRKCKYHKSVRAALNWLIAQQDKDGYLGLNPGRMYSHAISTIALCEAYGITGDKKLKRPAERAIAYTLAAQSPTRGGWRYSPGDDSDTSVTGWQYMALHSARMAGLKVPQENFDRARAFLDSMGAGKHGGLYGYQQRGDLSRAMVATGMFCRQLDLVPPSHPRQQESARLLNLHPMKPGRPDLYYVYYATLALYQHQGPIWTTWNERLKETLTLIQNQSGKDTGSWNPSASMTADGGRVVSTTLATLSLEVYYRILPMYGFRNQEATAPEKEQRE